MYPSSPFMDGVPFESCLGSVRDRVGIDAGIEDGRNRNKMTLGERWEVSIASVCVCPALNCILRNFVIYADWIIKPPIKRFHFYI